MLENKVFLLYKSRYLFTNNQILPFSLRAFTFKSLTPVPPPPPDGGATRKQKFLKRKHLIFPTIFCSLLIKYKPIILNANAVLFTLY